MHSADMLTKYAVCLFCPSHANILSKRLNVSSLFSPPDSHTILVFLYYTLWAASVLWHLVLLTFPNHMTSVFSGVQLWSDLSLDKYVNVVSAKCFFQLRQLRRIRHYLDDDSVATLVHVFVASRVDYCGSILTGAPRKTDKLQRVLNSAARIVSNMLIFGEVSYTGWTLSTGDRTRSTTSSRFGSEFVSRCSDVRTRWLLNTCLPTAIPSPASLAVATCYRLTVVISTFHVWNFLRTEDIHLHAYARPFELKLTSCLPSLLSATSKPLFSFY